MPSAAPVTTATLPFIENCSMTLEGLLGKGRGKPSRTTLQLASVIDIVRDFGVSWPAGERMRKVRGDKCGYNEGSRLCSRVLKSGEKVISLYDRIPASIEFESGQELAQICPRGGRG